MLQVNEELDALISRIRLEEGNTEYWKRRFLGEGLNEMVEGKSESPDVQDYIDVGEDDAKEAEDDDDEEVEPAEEEVEEPVQNQDVERIKEKEKEIEGKKPLQMIGVQLLKDSDLPSATSKRLRRRRPSRNRGEV
jgi:hypothetical protein